MSTLAECRAHLRVVEGAYENAKATLPKRYLPPNAEERARIGYLGVELKKARAALFQAELIERAAGRTRLTKKADRPRACLKKTKTRCGR